MFEGMLAKKYIFAQKRHSALTVCSIAIALALIVMLFTMFSTGMGILRNVAYSRGAYHIQIHYRTMAISKEEYDAVAEAVSPYGTCTPVEYAHENRYYANILLDEPIDSAGLFVGRIQKQTDLELNYTTNDLLILCDMKDAKAGLNMAVIIAVFYVFVLVLIMMLRLIIDTAFEISSKERERQFGVLQSIGATPKQIVRVMTYEGLMLSAVGIPLGTAAGIGLGYLVYRAVLGTGLMDLYLTPTKAAELVHFTVNPWLTLLGVVTGIVWVMLSAYGTGMRVIKMSPVQAISQRAGAVKKVHRASLFGKLFGWTGKIASRNNLRQPKRFIATVVSLTLSIAIFSAVTVVVNDLRGSADNYYEERGAESDFYVYLPYPYPEDDPFPYRATLKAVEESGLFKAPEYSFDVNGAWDIPEAAGSDYRESLYLSVRYLNKTLYDHSFHGAPPVPYEELAKSGGYIVNEEELADYIDYLNSEKSISLTFNDDEKKVTYSEEEYNALPLEEQEKFSFSYISRDENDNETRWYRYTPTFTVDFDIYYSAELRTSADLIATLDQYENGDYSLFTGTSIYYDSILCDLLDTDDYFMALEFFEQNSIDYWDNTVEHRRLLALLASVDIMAAFLSIMIALIAVVNMVNILATGLLNRRAELAALQCVGMTEKELGKMTVIECLQYALTSGIAAIAVCELMMLLTRNMMQIVIEEMQYLEVFINYIQPLPIIAAATVCAFAIALVASITAQQAMKRTSLVEQIRSVE